MRFTNLLSAFLLGLTVTSAAPTDDHASGDDAQTYQVVYSSEASGTQTCPATNNGNNRVYPAHTYTNNQLTAAYHTGATLQGNGKQIGANDYPHTFNNSQKFKFSCTGDFMEFPIQLNGQTYNGGDTGGVPDRVVYSYKVKGKQLQVQFCGVIRHGPGNAFIQCGP